MDNRVLVVLSLLAIAATHPTTGAQILVPQDHNTIQQAIEQAADGDTVLVAPGIYEGTGNVEIDFKRKAITLTSVSGPETTIIDCNGATVHGVRFNGSSNIASKLVGFTIRNAQGNGIHCGGEASPLIENCIIEDNSGWDGGGVFCTYFAAPLLRNCTIRNNRRIDGQHERGGGGLWAGHVTRPTLEGCRIYGNTAEKGGGVNASYKATVTLKNCLVYGNTATTCGGGLNAYGPFANITLVNCTVVDNHAQAGGGVFGTGAPDVPLTVRNSIIRDNVIPLDYDALKRQLRGIADDGTISSGQIACEHCIVSYSNIEGGWPGIGNVDTTPLFLNRRQDDYRLHSTSPCVDAGNPGDDCAREPEDNGDIINIGAYGNTAWAAVKDAYPTIASVSPLHGVVSREYVITIKGLHFGDGMGDGQLTIGSTASTDILTWSDDEITCRVTFPAEGSAEITIADSQGQSHTYPEPFTVHDNALIEISGDATGILHRDLTYLVTGEVVVPPGQELNIEPGVTVAFEQNKTGDPYAFVVKGTLHAVGESDAPIYFAPHASSAPGSWAGLVLAGDSLLECCDISLAEIGIRARHGHVIVNRCHIHSCNAHGMSWDGNEHGTVGLIARTTLENNGCSGLYSNGSIETSHGGIISGCILRGNAAWGIHVYAQADGAYSHNSQAVIEYSDITTNARGGIFLEAGSSIGSGWVDRSNDVKVSPDIVGCSIFGNGGAGVSCHSSGDTANANQINIYRDAYTSPRIDRCLVFANSDSGFSATCAEERSHASPSLSHCCFYNNGGYTISIDGKDAVATLLNCIVSTPLDAYVDIRSNASIVADYCLFDGNAVMPEGEGNLQGDPQWVDADHGDFSLMDTSPAIDAGICPIEGECDYFGREPDIGAIEWQE